MTSRQNIMEPGSPKSEAVGHTPLPWAQSHRKTNSGGYSTEIYDAEGQTIATVAWYPVPKEDGSTATARAANAELIVAAVNAHEAQSAILRQLAGWDHEDPLNFLEMMVAKARAIIA